MILIMQNLLRLVYRTDRVANPVSKLRMLHTSLRILIELFQRFPAQLTHNLHPHNAEEFYKLDAFAIEQQRLIILVPGFDRLIISVHVSKFDVQLGNGW